MGVVIVHPLRLDNAMTTNADRELECARRFSEHLRELGLLRPGYQCEVHLHRGNRKKRRDAEFEGNWDPDADSVRISFEHVEEEIDSEAGKAAAGLSQSL